MAFIITGDISYDQPIADRYSTDVLSVVPSGFETPETRFVLEPETSPDLMKVI